MYGKRRVILSPKPGRRIIVAGQGIYFPIGFWHEANGRFYADLKSRDQLYQSVSSETIAHKRVAGVPSQRALREFVMIHYEGIMRQ
jgi:hypothetical protein